MTPTVLSEIIQWIQSITTSLAAQCEWLPQTLRYCRIDAPSLEAAMAMEDRLQSLTEDCREAQRAFFEKREPVTKTVRLLATINVLDSG